MRPLNSGEAMMQLTFEVTNIVTGEQRSIKYCSETSIVDEFTAKKLIKISFDVSAVGAAQVLSRGVVLVGNYTVYAS